MARVVLVTGVSRDLGARFARALAADDQCEVLGVDLAPPRHDLGNVSFVRADIRNPVIAKVMVSHRWTPLCTWRWSQHRTSRRRSSMKEINVIGTMQLLAACRRQRPCASSSSELGVGLRRLAA
jgi:UDP-glucose 4-epimerase